MQAYKHKSVRVLATAAALVLGAAATLSASERHLRIVKTTPANAAVLAAAPEALKFWFSHEPDLRLTRVHVTRAGDKVQTAAPVADSTGKLVTVRLRDALRPGSYEVHWRTVARDGHAVAGKLGFRIDPAVVRMRATTGVGRRR